MGMVSAFLWSGDGHMFLTTTWVGLVVYFGYGDFHATERIRRAVSCIVLYYVGTVVCYGLGLLTKIVVLGSYAWGNFASQAAVTIHQVAVQSHTSSIGEYFQNFYIMTLGRGYAHSWTGELLTRFSAFAIIVSLLYIALSVYEPLSQKTTKEVPVRKIRYDLLGGVLWLVGLLLMNCIQFVIGDDAPFRAARILFIVHALCFSCSVLVLMSVNLRRSLLLSGNLLLGFVFFWALSKFEYFDIRRQIADTSPVLRSHFDIYYDTNRLIYVKARCTPDDLARPVSVHIYPAEWSDLQLESQPHGFDNWNFAFADYRLPGESCLAVWPLPAYPIAKIRTGQALPTDGGFRTLWQGGLLFTDGGAPVSEYAVIRQQIAHMTPLTHSGSYFDVYYHHTNHLIYVKPQCTPDDLARPVFVHIYPAEWSDLPQKRQPHGFDNYDFIFADYQPPGESCLAVRSLPTYPILTIHTGQAFPSGKTVWWGAFPLPGSGGNGVAGMTP